ncbi:MAG: glycosyltransferase family 2 protein [Chthoniobacterales bacterium]
MNSSNFRVPVSVLVPIKNEEQNLPRCLCSVRWADEIFVVDSKSADGSAEIAEQHGAKVVQFEFNGSWPKKKNWALEHLPFKNDWVFILDADEVLPAEAEKEFRDAIANAVEIVGYFINRRFFFLGRRLRHCYYPNWNLRLFRHSLGRYEKLTGTDTKSGDNEVHEHVVVQGPTTRLQCEIEHHAFPSVEVFVEKHNRYSNWEARVAADELLPKSSGRLGHASVERRRRLKLLARHFPFRPLLRFLHIYIWQKGFLDGRDGYYFARLHAVYEFLSVAKTYELRRCSDTAKD